MTENSPAVTPERLMQFGFAYAPPLIIEAALHHQLFDRLEDNPKTVEQMQAETGASPRGLRMLMNALVALEFLAKDEQNRYSLTPESAAFLVSSKPSFQGGLFRHVSRQLIPAWLELTEVVRTGKPSFTVNQEGAGADFFQQFVNDIYPMSYMPAKLLGDVLKLAQVDKPFRVLDLAAGSGVWGITLAQQSAQVRVTAVDWAGVIPVTQQNAERFGLSDRFQFIAADLLTADFGTGYDLAVLGHILHSEGEARSRQLLSRLFPALAAGGQIAIAEWLVNDSHTGPLNGAIFSVNMLVSTEAGDTFSFNQISQWLTESGFIDPHLVEVPGPSPLILATKP